MDQSDSVERKGNEALKQVVEISEDHSSTMPPTEHPSIRQQKYDITMQARLLEFQYQRHSLRISASNVAAMAGYHPYKNLPELLMQLVYQGHVGQALLQRDSQLLGLTLITPEEALNQLAKKAGVDKSLKEALKTVKKGDVSTVEKAQALKRTLTSNEVKKHLSQKEFEQFREGIRSAVDTNYGVVHENAALDEYQKICGWPIRERNAEIRSWAFVRSEDVSNGQNVDLEKTAIPMKQAESLTLRISHTDLDDCERPSLNKKPKTVVDLTIVHETIDRDEKVNSCQLDSPGRADDNRPTNKSATCLLSEEICSKEMSAMQVGKLSADATESDINELQIKEKGALSNDTTDNSPHSTTSSQPTAIEAVKSGVLPYFYILGSVDGIRDELAPTLENGCAVDLDDDDSWKMRSIIVECKHRMSRLHSPPPLYEQIQASIYCLMYGVNDADIVQVLRQDNKNKSTATKKGGQKSEKLQSASESPVQMDDVKVVPTKDQLEKESAQESGKPRILVSRVSLDDPTLQHKTNWTTIVLPRLRSFIDAVYSIRSSDDLRYRLLASSSESELGSVAAWEFLHELCPWLANCDTAFNRVTTNKP